MRLAFANVGGLKAERCPLLVRVEVDANAQASIAAHPTNLGIPSNSSRHGMLNMHPAILITNTPLSIGRA